LEQSSVVEAFGWLYLWLGRNARFCAQEHLRPDRTRDYWQFLLQKPLKEVVLGNT
jgi:hypothetical protein